MVAFGSHKPEGWFESTLRYKAGFDAPLMGGQFSGGENWDAGNEGFKSLYRQSMGFACKACLPL